MPGGRLDVVWTWSPPTPIPGIEEPLPVVAFEVESSWRTRKHVKGDLLNLQDAAVSLGVIVLAGADAKDESLRRFASSLVDRPGSRVLVWTDSDVRALAAGKATATAIAEEAAASAAALDAALPPSASVAVRLLSTAASTGPCGHGCHRAATGAPREFSGCGARPRVPTARLVPFARRPLAQLSRQRGGASHHRRRLARLAS